MDVQKPNHIDDSAHSAHMYDPEANGKGATEKVSKVTVHEVGKGEQQQQHFLPLLFTLSGCACYQPLHLS